MKGPLVFDSCESLLVRTLRMHGMVILCNFTVGTIHSFTLTQRPPTQMLHPAKGAPFTVVAIQIFHI